jgi:hypothetical protein
VNYNSVESHHDLPFDDIFFDELDELLSEGWSGVIKRLQTISLRLAEVIENFRVHRQPGVNDHFFHARCVLGSDPEVEVLDLSIMLRSYQPNIPPSINLTPVTFDLGEISVRESPVSLEMLNRHLINLHRSVFIAVEAVDHFVRKPGMPVPTFEHLVSLYIELARLSNVHLAMRTASKVGYSSKFSNSGEDMFGVGTQLLPIVDSAIPSRSLPHESKLSLPMNVGLDEVFAAHLLSKYVLPGEVCFEFVGETFNASQTNGKNHGTISAGNDPYHAPEFLCFDKRAASTAKTNTELVLQHMTEQGRPMGFADKMVEIAVDEKNCQFPFVVRLIKAIFDASESLSLAMSACSIYLGSRFGASAEYYDWLEKKQHEQLLHESPTLQKK